MKTTVFNVPNYNLDVTMECGQAFRWRSVTGGWEGVVQGRWVRLELTPSGLRATTMTPQNDWHWLEHYLQIHVDLEAIVGTFPQDDAMRASVAICRGMRLLRQDPWECLASFICSSNKQIVQIRQIIHQLCLQYGEPVAETAHGVEYAFPTFMRLASTTEDGLRACKMGFRAPYLLAAARRLAEGKAELGVLSQLTLGEAREHLTHFHGVGPKIADCVLLFAYGFPTAFPVDVWIRRAIERLYFRGRTVRPEKMEHFIKNHFGPHSGCAQQYLFHAVRTGRLPLPAAGTPRKTSKILGDLHEKKP